LPISVVCLSILLTSIDVLTKYWPFGHDTIMLCRFTKTAPCFAVYYSSCSVVCIAIDRYRCIVHPEAVQFTVAQVRR
jgi:hypothetical protein